MYPFVSLVHTIEESQSAVFTVSRAMDTNPASGSGRPALAEDHMHDPLVSIPAERDTSQAALVDAIFSEDVEKCRQLLDAHPDLVNTPLQHHAYFRTKRGDMAYEWIEQPLYQYVTPVVFASVAPRFREPRNKNRALSPSGLAIIALLVARGAALDANTHRDFWAQHLLIHVCRYYDSPEALGLLIQIGANIHTRQLDDFKRTLLQAAASRGAIGAIGFLLDNEVPMNYSSPEEDGDAISGAPLHWAAANARHDVVQLLPS